MVRNAKRHPEKLSAYRGKRAPELTNEPFGDEVVFETASSGRAKSEGTRAGAFVLHLHDATRRHYDLRLEVGGVLLSFAVPKGPSLDPAERVLAVKTEDHPLEYIEFEDVIPAGQYGGGSMIVWDRGAVSYPEGPAEAELAQGKLHIELRGMKIRGTWVFVKLANSKTGADWLLFKKPDEHTSSTRKILEELPRSILSGLTVDELPQKAAIARAHVDHARSAGAKSSSAIAKLGTSTRAPLIDATTAPLEAKRGALYDPNLDGVRVLATRDGDVVTLRHWPAHGEERIEEFYPDVVRALRALPNSRLALDGELVAFDPSGYPSLPLLAERARRVARGEAHRAVTTTPVVLVVKDILALEDRDTRPLPLEGRRRLVSALLPALGVVRAAEPLDGDRKRIIATAASLGIASVVAKVKGSPYSLTARVWEHVPTGIAPRSREVVEHERADTTRSPSPKDEGTRRRPVVTNRNKVFWPSDGYTKGDLVDYYTNVADVIGPYLKDRPVILVRYPDGIDGKSFYQWNVPASMPPWVRTLTIEDEDAPRADAPKRVFLVDDASTLVYIANLGCIPLHVLASRTPDLASADFLTLDFDVKQTELRHAVTLARTLRELLDRIGLPGYPKTSGQSGLHVLVPLGRRQGFDTARTLADLLGRLLVERHPDIATMERIVRQRGPRVYVDTGQTGSSRAIVAPYSVRAVPGATVSTPLDWDEVTPQLDPRAFTIGSVPARIAARGDLLKGLLDAPVDVMAAVAKLAEIVPKSLRPPR